MNETKLNPLTLFAGQGSVYEWMNDKMFVLLTRADTGGAFTLIQDNLKAGFHLGMHLHRVHTETFYILEGEIEFQIGDTTQIATAGTLLYIPPNTPHAVKTETPGRMLMLYSPAGFEEMLEELKTMRPAEFEDAARMDALNEKYDIVNLA